MNKAINNSCQLFPSMDLVDFSQRRHLVSHSE